MNLKGTYTEKNLITAIQGEALAHFKYQIYASLLGKESKDVENRINEIAHNEKEHGKVWKKALLGDDYYDNKKNLLDAIDGELHEHKEMYPEFARIAREEGFDEIADLFEKVADIEGHHAMEFKNILNKDINNIHSKHILYKCLNCGYIYQGDEAPQVCPVCQHPHNYFVRVD